ncbi:uncharacterized protein LOC114521645 [Dendronephthya gigantea]|uniref:uncharacterized protein LOC114521645 n=1 Tax=Dendronephthya gigantea TaxID=151771 RepID=UPI00106B21E2|nr:uncharacterized protein LOC114521645 [Dendronephthya gigantea]
MRTSNKKINCESIDLESLINFTTVATGFINSVLKKPLKSKRKVNHRKFLQKQLGAHTHYKSIFINNTEEIQNSDRYIYSSGSGTNFPETTAKTVVRSRNTIDSCEEKSLEKLFNPTFWGKAPSKEQKISFNSLRNRLLPESFWKEPVKNSSSFQREYMHAKESGEVDAFELLGVEFDELLEKLSEDSDVLSTSSGDCLSDSPSHSELETTVTSDESRNITKTVYDQIWSLSTDIVNFTQSEERYLF